MLGPDVFCLTSEDGSILPPATQATVLAKYSRSPDPAREVLRKLTGEEADRFSEKWVIGYGHSSVAELATVPICLEGISIVASKFVEQWPRAGYSEKSTRYQVFTEDSFVTPPGAPSTMKEYAARYFAAYRSLYPRVVRRCAELMGLDPDDPEVTSSAKVKARAFDNVRYLLPAGTGTNVAAVMNLRDARYMISAARGHSNPEFRDLGERVLAAVSEVCPALVKNAEPDVFEPPITSLEFEDEARVLQGVPGVILQNWTEGGTTVVKGFVETRYGMNWETFSKHMESRGDKQVPAAFKSVRVEFDVMMDFGAYRDLQRHRRCDQYAEPLTPFLGYVVPDDIAGTDMEPEYREAMESVQAYDDERVVNDRDLMQYMVPLGYLHRSSFSMDLRELYYVVELRTRPQGHISYRRIAYAMYECAKLKYPELMRWCRAVRPDAIGEHA